MSERQKDKRYHSYIVCLWDVCDMYLFVNRQQILERCEWTIRMNKDGIFENKFSRARRDPAQVQAKIN